MSYTIEEAFADTLAAPAADLIACNVAFLVEKEKLQEHYPDLDDVPEPLQSFLAAMFETMTEFETTYCPGL